MDWETFIIAVAFSSPKTSCWSLRVFDIFIGGLHPANSLPTSPSPYTLHICGRTFHLFS